MILDEISRYGAHFEGISVISKLAIFCNAQSLSSWESVENEALVAPFLFSTTQLSIHKNDRILNSSPTDISATEKLSNTTYC